MTFGSFGKASRVNGVSVNIFSSLILVLRVKLTTPVYVFRLAKRNPGDGQKMLLINLGSCLFVNNHPPNNKYCTTVAFINK